MVKGISRQVILVQPPEPKLFEQAIFILKDGKPVKNFIGVQPKEKVLQAVLNA